MAKSIMIQGTGSGVGKSVLCAALCRIFFEDGLRAAPFKSQNMSLNSFVTRDGREMARSQVVQAEAAGVEPAAEMNPLLLKPNSDTGCQVIVNGKVIGDYTAAQYGSYQRDIWPVIRDSYQRLAGRHDVIVIEGAGSPAEINLKDRDFVNMRTAAMADAPVLLAADIDRGGVFASLVGTLQLLEPDERARIKGFIINKFRGDPSLLMPGIEFLERKTGIPVIGVVPFFRGIYIQEEDGVPREWLRQEVDPAPRSSVNIVVVHLPHIANFTDFDALAAAPGVTVRYIDPVTELGAADVVIIPGSKNTIGDLLYLRRTGMEQRIRDYAASGGMVVGICGGYQMLGISISDPHRVDGSLPQAQGLGLLPVTTVMEKVKQTVQVAGTSLQSGFWEPNRAVTGYEIHMGRTERLSGADPAFLIEDTASRRFDGALSKDRKVWGTYLHGVFDSDEFRQSFLEAIKKAKGIEAGGGESYHRLKQEGFEKLAAIVRAHIDMKRVYQILQGARL